MTTELLLIKYGPAVLQNCNYHLRREILLTIKLHCVSRDPVADVHCVGRDPVADVHCVGRDPVEVVRRRVFRA